MGSGALGTPVWGVPGRTADDKNLSYRAASVDLNFLGEELQHIIGIFCKPSGDSSLQNYMASLMYNGVDMLCRSHIRGMLSKEYRRDFIDRYQVVLINDGNA